MIARVLIAGLIVAASAPAWAEPTAPRPLPLVEAAVVAPPMGPPGSDGVVNLNSAPEEKLTLLPGIGPAKARAILEHRRVHPFRRVDELVKVKGIGRKLFGNVRHYVTVAGPTTLNMEVKSLRR
jgi:competence protein ComEA